MTTIMLLIALIFGTENTESTLYSTSDDTATTQVNTGGGCPGGRKCSKD